MVPEKHCPRCDHSKSSSFFNRNKSKSDGLATWCKGCMVEYRKSVPEIINKIQKKSAKKRMTKIVLVTKKWRHNNKDKMRLYNRSRTVKYKVWAIMYYSMGTGKCKCCGEDNILFLTIDHPNNNGKQHRKITGQGANMYTWLHSNKYPPGFDVLCFNCNCGRSVNSGTCPHTYISNQDIQLIYDFKLIYNSSLRNLITGTENG